MLLHITLLLTEVCMDRSPSDCGDVLLPPSPLAACCQGTVMPDSNESFMDGSLGLGMAIPEEATAALGPLPSLMGSNRTERDEVPYGSCTLCLLNCGMHAFAFA